MTVEHNYGPLKVIAGLSAALLGGGYLMGYFDESHEPRVPKFVDRVALGMSVGELEVLGGGRGFDEGLPGAPTLFEFPPEDDAPPGLQMAGRDPVRTQTRFRDGKLVYFELRVDEVRGKRVDPAEIAALMPILLQAKMLRTSYSKKDLFDALGKGARIARILDEERGEIDVFRWELDKGDARPIRFETHVADGQVIEHHLSDR